MEIVDSKGMYTILVDKRRRIVYEKLIGALTSEDFKRFIDDYKNIVFNEIGNYKPWAKFCNLSNYKASGDFNELTDFLKLSVENGFNHGIIITNDPLVKSQMHEIAKRTSVTYSFFDGIDAFEDAIDWLEFNGYTLEKPHYV